MKDTINITTFCHCNAANPDSPRIPCNVSNNICRPPYYCTLASTASVSTVSPALTLSVTVPAQGATISFSIFIASRIRITSPDATVSPLLTLTLRTVPGIGATTSPAPPATGAAAGAGAGAAGAAGAGAGAAA